jgi:hypothetical protein
MAKIANRKYAPKKSKSAVRKSPKRKPAVLHDKRFPNESAGYRNARNALLKAEIGLRSE